MRNGRAVSIIERIRKHATQRSPSNFLRHCRSIFTEIRKNLPQHIYNFIIIYYICSRQLNNVTMKQTKTTNHSRTFTMRDVFNALVKENGEAQGSSIFVWYCNTYKVTIEDIAPDSVKREVFGM